MNRIRLLIADDHDGYRRALVGMFQDDSRFEVVADSASGDAAIAAAEANHADVLLVDLHMKGTGGLQVCRMITEARLPLVTILMSVADANTYREEALSAGAIGCLNKGFAPDDLFFLLRSRPLCGLPALRVCDEKEVNQKGRLPRFARRRTTR